MNEQCTVSSMIDRIRITSLAVIIVVGLISFFHITSDVIFAGLIAVVAFISSGLLNNLRENKESEWLEFKEALEEESAQEEIRKAFYEKYLRPLEMSVNLLGLSSWPVDQKALHAAWREKAKVYHPDRGGSIEQMQAINDAYEFLKPYAE